MLSIKIKEEHQSTIVGFGDSGLPLGERNESDLVALAEMAQYDQHLASFFEVLPSPAEIADYKQELFLQTHPAPAPAERVDEHTEADHRTSKEEEEENHEL